MDKTMEEHAEYKLKKKRKSIGAHSLLC